MTPGERIRQRRLELGLTQEDVAIKLGCKSRSTVNKIELSKDVSLKIAKQYANVLSMSVFDIMGWDESPEETGSMAAELIADVELFSYMKKLHKADDKTRKMIFSMMDVALGEK